MKIVENVLLSDFTTFKIGGMARFFVTVKSIADVADALLYATEKSLPVFVLGGGSNVLINDQGFPGLVIKMEIGGIEQAEDGDTVRVTVGAGVSWDELVKISIDRGWGGLENLSGIPGTVGAAPIQNIGAYGAEAKDVISSVEVLDMTTGDIRTLAAMACQFGYRDSIFKKSEGKSFIVTRVEFTLSKKPTLNTSYKDIADYIYKNKTDNLTPKKIRDIVLEIRAGKFPDLTKFGTAGSFFKNPILSKTDFNEVQKKYPSVPNFPAPENKVKFSAGWIIDTVCGLKGFREGDVGVYEKQALVLVNFGSGTAVAVNALAEKIIQSVKEKAGISLEREVQSV